jgi:hypothetical protein
MNDFQWLVTGVVVAGGLVALAVRVVAGRNRQTTAFGGSKGTPDTAQAVAPSGLEWAIIERMAEGLVVLSDLLRPIAANRAGRDLLGFPEGPLPPRLPSDEVRGVARLALERSLRAGPCASVPNLWTLGAGSSWSSKTSPRSSRLNGCAASSWRTRATN